MSDHNFTSRRSTRVKTDVFVELQGEKFVYAGETVTVNLHGALVRVSFPLTVGDRIVLHVHLTGKSATATVVFADSDLSQYGIELDTPNNIWGIALPPSDWEMRRSDAEVAE